MEADEAETLGSRLCPKLMVGTRACSSRPDVSFGSVLLKNSVANTSKRIWRNDDSLRGAFADDRYAEVFRLIRKLPANVASGVFQHNRSEGYIIGQKGTSSVRRVHPAGARIVCAHTLRADIADQLNNPFPLVRGRLAQITLSSSECWFVDAGLVGGRFMEQSIIAPTCLQVIAKRVERIAAIGRFGRS